MIPFQITRHSAEAAMVDRLWRRYLRLYPIRHAHRLLHDGAPREEP